MMEREGLGQDPLMKHRQYVPQVSWKRGTINPFPDGKLRHPESGTMRKPPALTRVSSQNSVSPTLDPSQNPGGGARMIWRKTNRKMMKREGAAKGRANPRPSHIAKPQRTAPQSSLFPALPQEHSRACQAADAGFPAALR